jgi:DNA polymerase alpha subunit A
LCDEITEDQYKTIAKGSLQRDDFVVDDGVGGYMDNGMDDWTGQDDADEEDDLRSRKDCTYASNRYRTLILDHGTAKKKATGASAKAKVKPKAPPPAAEPSISAYRPTVSVEREEDFLANLLGGIDTAPLPAPVRSKKRKPSFDSSMDFSDMDMNDFMDIDDLDVKPSVPVKKEPPRHGSLHTTPSPSPPKTPWDPSLPSYPLMRSRTMAVYACFGWTVSSMAVNSISSAK